MKLVLFTLIGVVSAAAVADTQSFDRYQSIIDRQMFGKLPPGFDPEKMPSEVAKTSRGGKELTKEQKKLQSSVHFSVINVAADGTPVVGFSDNSDPKAPVHHYIKAGGESGGWKVLSVDTAEKSMTVQKDGVELTLKLGDNSGASGKTANGGGASAAVPAVASAAALSAPRRSGLLGTLGSRRALRERQMREREDAEKQEREAERARREAEREEQRQQLLAIQEELKRQRDVKRSEKQKTEQNEGQNNADNNAE